MYMSNQKDILISTMTKTPQTLESALSPQRTSATVSLSCVTLYSVPWQTLPGAGLRTWGWQNPLRHEVATDTSSFSRPFTRQCWPHHHLTRCLASLTLITGGVASYSVAGVRTKGWCLLGDENKCDADQNSQREHLDPSGQRESERINGNLML